LFGSLVVYAGLAVFLAGVILVIKPIRRRGIRNRKRALLVAAAGVTLLLAGLFLPAPESRIDQPRSQLDDILPAWQFSEFHRIRIDAPPQIVFEAIRQVRADEIVLFRALTWIRRGGRRTPENILNPGSEKPILDVATRTGFIYLADEPPREVVIGTAVIVPPDGDFDLTPEAFRRRLPPGFALAAMNFAVRADGLDRSVLTTETRVHANSPAARRQFGMYWRVIYPGSALLRRTWLQAIRKRAEGSGPPL
jgi:hypothetical protein